MAVRINKYIFFYYYKTLGIKYEKMQRAITPKKGSKENYDSSRVTELLQHEI
jgi:hypothetical protein